jgi:hypothetical protein
MGWVYTSAGWRHRPRWKRVINRVLRWFQPRRRRKWVIYTKCDDSTSPPTIKGYGFGPILHYDDRMVNGR